MKEVQEHEHEPRKNSAGPAGDKTERKIKARGRRIDQTQVTKGKDKRIEKET